MYALSANYGGLIARMLFRPIEDSSRNLFANLCSDAGEARRVGGVTKKGESKQSNANIREAASVLGDILRIYGLVSLVAFAIGPYAAPLLLRVVAGARWSDTGAGEVLGTYCYYIPLLAINGVSEAFVSATASTSELRRQSIWMGAFFVAFAASAYLFLSVLQMGAKGLVLANCVNMASRILFNMSFLKNYFTQRGVVSAIIFWHLWTSLIRYRNSKSLKSSRICMLLLPRQWCQDCSVGRRMYYSSGVSQASSSTLASLEHHSQCSCAYLHPKSKSNKY